MSLTIGCDGGSQFDMRRTVSWAEAEALRASSDIDAYANFLIMTVTVGSPFIGSLTLRMLAQLPAPFKLEKMKMHNFMPEG